MLNMIKQKDCQEDCGFKENYSSGDFQQQRTLAYNYNVLEHGKWKQCGLDL